MPRPDRSAEIDAALLKAVSEHPSDLVSMVAAQLGLSRQRIHQQVLRLVAGGYLVKSGSTRPRYALGVIRMLLRPLERTGLADDRELFAAFILLLGHRTSTRRNVS